MRAIGRPISAGAGPVVTEAGRWDPPQPATSDTSATAAIERVTKITKKAK